MKEIQQPTPPKNPMSKGLLSPHDSILNALNTSEVDNKSNRLAKSHRDDNTSAKNKENFNVSSWLDINNNDYSNLYPIRSRPGSSVLSSSPDLDSAKTHESHFPANFSQNASLALNESPLHNQDQLSGENHTAEAFILPDFSNYRKRNQLEQQLVNYSNNSEPYEYADDKILILGSKKFQVYDSLSLPVQSNFTTHLGLSPSIILVIFDGLNKIGNILNQLKFLVQQKRSYSLNSQLEEEDMVIIPFYKNIDFHVIINLLESYRLLCNPIRYNSRQEISGVLSSLIINNYLDYQDPPQGSMPHDYINLSDQDDHTIELPLNQQNFAPVKTFPLMENVTDNLTIESPDQRKVSNKSILIKHQITKSLSNMNMSNFNSTSPSLNGHSPKKRRQPKMGNSSLWSSVCNFTSKLFSCKFWQRQRYLLVPLAIGLGIGVLLALTYPYLKVYMKPAEEEVILRSSKRVKRELLRDNVKLFSSKLQGAVRYLARKTQRVIDQWDEHIINSTNGYNGAILWSI
ncbi:hypothetical protein WICPIJ_000612 [Wickerhamomyces pijperi]|uniref:Uncharacterized protein n=1 Tax=Wickerhamomyces pijperi TaxID=599730 RepID=A0A9P8TRT5_WICPI|nr:hypothetical protein WICPIJ_000612 [Wickerhamomyces pijperi]